MVGNMTVLIDADSLVYSVPYGCADVEEVKEKFDTVIKFIVNQISETYELDRIIVYHGATGVNFRKEITDTYKANRKRDKPDFYYDLSNYVKFAYDAISAKDEEVDDLIARDWAFCVMQEQPVCIVSIDKDYRQLKDCLIYNYGKGKDGETKGWEYISPYGGDYNFYTQMIVGDPADNIKGVEGKGVKYAEKLLGDATTTFSLFLRVYTTYLLKYGIDARKLFRMNYRLLKIG